MPMLQDAQANAAPQPAAPPPRKGSMGGAPPTASEGASMVGVGQPNPRDQSEASPEEQQEYQRAMNALGEVLYKNDQLSDSVLKFIREDDKVGSAVKASILLIQQIDQKLNLDEVVIPQFTQDVVDRVIDLAENGKGIEYNEQEVTATLGATWEGVMDMYGVDEDSYRELTQGMSPEDISGYEQQYKQFLGD